MRLGVQMKIRVTKHESGGLFPFDSEARDVVSKWKIGDMIEIDARKPRNYKHHKKFFALLDLFYTNTDLFSNQHECLEWFKIKCGIYKTIKVGETYYPITGSISFSKMEQDEFDLFYNKAIQAALDELPVGYEALATQLAIF